MTDRADEALRLVENDDEARDIFVAAYGSVGGGAGAGDSGSGSGSEGIAALREAVEPDVAAAGIRDERVARLRRLAFGRTVTDEDEATAAEARRELEGIAAGERASGVALDRAVTAVLEARAHPPVIDDATSPTNAPGSVTPDSLEADSRDPDSLDPDPFDDEPARPRRRWVLPAVIGLVVGALLAGVASAWMLSPTGAGEQPAPDPTSTGIDYFLGDPPESTAIPGDLAASERWFEPEQTDEDLVGVGELRPEFDRDSVRLVHSSSLARVWVAKQVDGKLCLETTETETQITSGTCATSVDFTSRGISVSSNVLTATWNGAQIRVVLTQR